MKRLHGLEDDRSVNLLFVMLEGLLMLTVIISAIRGKMNFVGLSVSSMFLLLLPTAVEQIFSIRIKSTMKKAIYIYIVAGPVGGNIYHLYYTIPFWDKLLHLFCGILFAMLGYSLPDLAEPDHSHRTALRWLSGICGAMCIGALWEIFEFSCDRLFGLDLQNDCVITDFSSYLLGDKMGERGTINDITSVVVNGKELGVGGYIDIGLFDTMMDLVMCLIGAIGYCTITSIRANNVQPLVTRRSAENKKTNFRHTRRTAEQ